MPIVSMSKNSLQRYGMIWTSLDLTGQDWTELVLTGLVLTEGAKTK